MPPGGLALQQGGNEPAGGGDPDSSGLCLLLSHLTEPSEAFWRPSAPLEGPGSSLVGVLGHPAHTASSSPPLSPSSLPGPGLHHTVRSAGGPGGLQCHGCHTLLRAGRHFHQSKWGMETRDMGGSRVRAWPESLRAPQHNGAPPRRSPPSQSTDGKTESQGHPLSQGQARSKPVSSASRAESAGSHRALLSGLTGLGWGHLTLTHSTGLCQAPSGTHRLSFLSPNKPGHLLSRYCCLLMVSHG